jgi:hypothetical protein
MDNLNSQSYRSKLNPITKESLTMTSIALWTAFLKSLDQQLLLTEQLMLQTPDTDQLAANYDEKLKQMEKARKKILRWARIVRKSLIE